MGQDFIPQADLQSAFSANVRIGSITSGARHAVLEPEKAGWKTALHDEILPRNQL